MMRTQRWTLWAICSLLMTGPLYATVKAASNAPATYAKDRILVRYRPTASVTGMTAMAQRRALQVQQYLPGSGIAVVQVPAGETPEALIQRLITEESGTVADARLDYLRQAVATTNDPDLNLEYHIAKCNVSTAWDTTTGSGITIAIADTGVDLTHPDLAAHYKADGKNFGDNNSNVQDFYGHGTAVAGTAAAIGNNGIGVVGVAYSASILPIKISLGTTDSAFDSAIISGIEYAADQGAKVVNVSFGGACGTCASDSWEDAAKYMRSKGGLVTVAAGNSTCDLTCAAHPGMVIVAATNSSDAAASFSNFGSAVDVSAPGEGIVTTICPACTGIGGGQYGSVNGTSFAAPLTAGVLGLIYAIDPNFTADQAAQILYDSADDIGLGPTYGHGRVNAGRALALAATRSAAFQAQQTTLSNVYVYPNPWDIRNPNYSSQKKVTISNVPSNATVKIFTLSGVWIKTLAPQNSQAIWDLTNDSGQDVASGLYIYLVTGNGNKIRGKIALIR
jgi:thermitase